jgi:transketolase
MTEQGSEHITDREGCVLELSNNKIKHLDYLCEMTRKDIIDTLYKIGRGHSGPSLSMVELLITLYFAELRINDQDPKWQDRDRFILSKGHGALGFYAALVQRGLIQRKELNTFESLGSRLQGHVDSNWLPWVEVTTGSLGQGLSFCLGVALAAQKQNKEIRAYCILGDGECEEGNVWEAAMTAAKYKVDNLLAIVDWNNLQGGVTLEVMPSLEPFAAKWQAFGWHTIEINGHDLYAILRAYHQARQVKGKPSVIIARTIKGKGVSYMENKVEWHSGTVTTELYQKASKEIGFRLEALSRYANWK